MKTPSLFARLTLAVAMALGFVANTTHLEAATAPGSQSNPAKVSSVSGSATYTTGGRAVNIEPGIEIPEGSIITTGPNSTVVLNLGASGMLSVKPESTLSIDKLRVQGAGADTIVETQLEVRKGSILGNVKKLSAASKYEVKTEKGVAGIRGTAFQIFAVGIFRCSDGSIQVTLINISNPGQAPQVFTVTPGREVNASGNAPASVQPVAAAIVRELRQEAAVLGGIGGREGALVLVVGDPDQIRRAVQNAVNQQNQNTTNQQRPEKEVSEVN